MRADFDLDDDEDLAPTELDREAGRFEDVPGSEHEAPSTVRELDPAPRSASAAPRPHAAPSHESTVPKTAVLPLLQQPEWPSDDDRALTELDRPAGDPLAAQRAHAPLDARPARRAVTEAVAAQPAPRPASAPLPPSLPESDLALKLTLAGLIAVIVLLVLGLVVGLAVSFGGEAEASIEEVQ